MSGIRNQRARIGYGDRNRPGPCCGGGAAKCQSADQLVDHTGGDNIARRKNGRRSGEDQSRVIHHKTHSQAAAIGPVRGDLADLDTGQHIIGVENGGAVDLNALTGKGAGHQGVPEGKLICAGAAAGIDNVQTTALITVCIHISKRRVRKNQLSVGQQLSRGKRNAGVSATDLGRIIDGGHRDGDGVQIKGQQIVKGLNGDVGVAGKIHLGQKA